MFAIEMAWLYKDASFKRLHMLLVARKTPAIGQSQQEVS